MQIKCETHNALKCHISKDTNMIIIGQLLTEPFEKSIDIHIQNRDWLKKKWLKLYNLWANTKLCLCNSCK
jgi:hypothetical protein